MSKRTKRLVPIIEMCVSMTGIIVGITIYDSYDGPSWPLIASLAGVVYSTVDVLVLDSCGRGLSERIFSPTVKLCSKASDGYYWCKTWREYRQLGRGDEFV